MAAEGAQYMQKDRQIYLAIQWLNREIKQFTYVTLQQITFNIPESPTSTDLMIAQEQIAQAIAEYEAQNPPTSCLVRLRLLK